VEAFSDYDNMIALIMIYGSHLYKQLQ